MRWISNIIQNRILQHILFWLAAFVILVRIFTRSGDLSFIDTLYALLFLVTIIPSTYVVLAFAVPRFLSKKRIFVFSTVAITAILLGSFFNQFFFEVLVDYLLPGYYFISYHQILEIMQFFVVIVTVATLLKLSRGWFEVKDSQEKMMEMEKVQLSTELLGLKSQINPHFLFNSLNSVYSMALKESKEISAVILKLSDAIRYMVYETSDETIAIDRELEFLQDYVELQKLRLSANVQIEFNLEGDFSNHRIAPLLLLPLIENAFKHGAKGAIDEAFVSINMKSENEKLYFHIRNNKGEVDEVETGRYGGLGLANVKRRLELIYPERHQLEISDNEFEFAVFLGLELK